MQMLILIIRSDLTCPLLIERHGKDHLMVLPNWSDSFISNLLNCSAFFSQCLSLGGYGSFQFIPLSEFHQQEGKVVDEVNYYITTKLVLMVKDDYKYFGAFLDQQGEWMDSVHIPECSRPIRLTGQWLCYIEGKVVEDFSVYNIEVMKMK